MGPEDPLADTCAAIFASVFTGACKAAIHEARKGVGEFDTAACKEAAGCGCLNGGERSVERVFGLLQKLERLLYEEERHARSVGSCSDWCRRAGAGDVGNIIGTAPFCDASCNECPGKCTVGGVDEFTDYGSGCMSGNKICCCQRERHARSVGSCSDWCRRAGGGNVGNIIGTAPFCEANCNECPGKCTYGGVDEFTDYGSGCMSGNKICCCQRERHARSVGSCSDWCRSAGAG